MCGIWGQINVKKSKFNKTLFNVLGIHNDTRGGDSCGIFIDGKTEYGVNEKKLYSKFFNNSELIKNTTHCKIALGHCRKASVGVINETTAQPIVIKNDNGDIEFVLMHNGTIYNYKALAKKYIPDIDITGMTDSQVMARIFYHCGYDCLSEYYGGAVFVIVDYRNGTKVYLFKGASKQYSYSTVETEERPFYFIHSNTSFVFSSLNTYLNTSNPEEEIFTIFPNQLIEVRGDDIYIVKEYPRDNVAQSLPSNGTKEYWKNVYGYDDEDYYDWDNKNTTSVTVISKDKKEDPKWVRITSDGVYHLNNITVHGKYYLNMYGKVYDSKLGDTKEIWFWDGILLYGALEFQFLVNLCSYYQMSPEDVKWTCPEILNYLSPYPIKDPDYTGGTDKWVKCTDMDNIVPFTNTIQFFLESKTLYCKEGEVSHTIWRDRKDCVKILDTLISTKTVNLPELYNLLYNGGNR